MLMKLHVPTMYRGKWGIEHKIVRWSDSIIYGLQGMPG